MLNWISQPYKFTESSSHPNANRLNKFVKFWTTLMILLTQRSRERPKIYFTTAVRKWGAIAWKSFNFNGLPPVEKHESLVPFRPHLSSAGRAGDDVLWVPDSKPAAAVACRATKIIFLISKDNYFIFVERLTFGLLRRRDDNWGEGEWARKSERESQARDGANHDFWEQWNQKRFCDISRGEKFVTASLLSPADCRVQMRNTTLLMALPWFASLLRYRPDMKVWNNHS